MDSSMIEARVAQLRETFTEAQINALADAGLGVSNPPDHADIGSFVAIRNLVRRGLDDPAAARAAATAIETFFASRDTPPDRVITFGRLMRLLDFVTRAASMHHWEAIERMNEVAAARSPQLYAVWVYTDAAVESVRRGRAPDDAARALIADVTTDVDISFENRRRLARLDPAFVTDLLADARRARAYLRRPNGGHSREAASIAADLSRSIEAFGHDSRHWTAAEARAEIAKEYRNAVAEVSGLRVTEIRRLRDRWRARPKRT